MEVPFEERRLLELDHVEILRRLDPYERRRRGTDTPCAEKAVVDALHHQRAGDPHEDMGVGLGEMLDRQLLGMLELPRRVMTLARERDVWGLRGGPHCKTPGSGARGRTRGG